MDRYAVLVGLGLGMGLLSGACRSTPAPSASTSTPRPLEVRPLASMAKPVDPTAAAAAVRAAPKGTRTREGFLRTTGTLTKRPRHVNVIELPRGTLPIDVELTGSAAPTASARLKRDLGWKDKDAGATVTRSPDGKYALAEGGTPKELVVFELKSAGFGVAPGSMLGAIVRREKDPYRTLQWMGPHDLVADDGKNLLRADGSTSNAGATAFAPASRSPKLAKSKDSREEVLDFEPSLAHVLTHHVGSEIYGMTSASVLDVKTGERRTLIDEDEKSKRQIVDVHLGLERTCVARFEGGTTADTPLPPTTYLCAPTPWDANAFEPLLTTRIGAGYIATANKHVVLLVDKELHVFDVEAKTERVYAAPVAYSLSALDEKEKFLLAPGATPLLLDVEAETLDTLDGWVPSDIGGYATTVLPRASGETSEKLRIFVEAHGDRFSQPPPPNARRLFVLEIE